MVSNEKNFKVSEISKEDFSQNIPEDIKSTLITVFRLKSLDYSDLQSLLIDFYNSKFLENIKNYSFDANQNIDDNCINKNKNKPSNYRIIIHNNEIFMENDYIDSTFANKNLSEFILNAEFKYNEEISYSDNKLDINIKLNPVEIVANKNSKDNIREYYHGCWNSQREKSGFGILITSLNDFYFGTFRSDKLHGLGIFIKKSEKGFKVVSDKIKNPGDEVEKEFFQKSQAYSLLHSNNNNIDINSNDKNNNNFITSIKSHNNNINNINHNKDSISEISNSNDTKLTHSDTLKNRLISKLNSNKINTNNGLPHSNRAESALFNCNNNIENKPTSDTMDLSNINLALLNSFANFVYSYDSYLKNKEKNKTEGIKKTNSNEFWLSLENDIYIGEFTDSQANGYGNLFLVNGDFYFGSFKENKKHGTGKYIFSNGDCYEGEFLNDKVEGKGKFTFLNGSFYQGQFVNWSFSGYGEMHWIDGRVYKGNWNNNKLCGYGEHKFSNGDSFSGDYIDDKKSGKGKYVWNEQAFYEGHFVNNKIHGKGDYSKNNTTTHGIWSFGRLSLTDKISGIIQNQSI